MTIVEMEYYQTVCKYESLTKAANHLHITQPTLSVAMKNIEKECRVSLFTRTSNSITLTDEGKVLLDEIEKVLSQYTELMHSINELNLSRKYLRIGMSTLNGNLVFPKLLKEFNQLHPDIDVISFEKSSQEQFEMLDKGLLDLILTVHTFHAQGLEKIHPAEQYGHLPLIETSTCFCVSKDHALADQNTVTLEQISKEPLVMLTDNFSQTIRIKRLLQTHHLPCRIIHQTNQMYTIERFIEQNSATGFLPKAVALNNPNIHPIPFLDETRYVELFWRKDHYLFSSAKAFIQLAKSLYN